MKEGYAVLLETWQVSKSGEARQVEIEITDPKLVLLFRRYFSDKLWSGIPAMNRDRSLIKEFLRAQFSEIYQLMHRKKPR